MFISGEKIQIFGLFFTTILAWASFFGIIFFTNPRSAGILGVSVLYAGAIAGFAGLLIILWQVKKLKKK